MFTMRHHMTFGTTWASLTSFDLYCSTQISPIDTQKLPFIYRRIGFLNYSTMAALLVVRLEKFGTTVLNYLSCHMWMRTLSVRVKATTCSESPRGCVFQCYSHTRDHYLFVLIYRINVLLRHLDLSWRMIKETSICTVQWGISAQYLRRYLCVLFLVLVAVFRWPHVPWKELDIILLLY